MALDAGWDDELLTVELSELQDLGFTTVGIKKFSDKHCKTGSAS